MRPTIESEVPAGNSGLLYEDITDIEVIPVDAGRYIPSLVRRDVILT